MHKIIEQCLVQLRDVDEQRAKALEDEFRSRADETMDMDDVQRVVNILREANEQAALEEAYLEASDSIPIDAQVLYVESAEQLLKAPTDPLDDFEPFVASLDGGMELVAAVDRLAGTNNFVEFELAARALFVEQLGFTDQHRDLTRLFKQSGLGKVVRIATFGEFNISLVHLNTFTSYTSTLRPVFSQFPYGLVLTMTPNGQTIRAVFRRVNDTGEFWFRTLAGQPFGREPSDNLLVWSRRFSLMRPEYGDDAHQLRQKVHTAFEPESHRIAAKWQSAPFTVAGSDVLPGIGWEDAAVREIRSLFQIGLAGDERRYWGLQAALRNRFPISIARGKATLHYLHYDWVDLPLSEAISDSGAHETRAATVRIHLKCAFEGELGVDTEYFSLNCRIPVPDRHGVFLLNGCFYAFHPELSDRGDFFFEIPLSDAELEEEFFEEFEGGSTNEDLNKHHENEHEHETEQRAYRGASIRGLLEYLIERKLGGIAVNLWYQPAELFQSPDNVFASLSRWFDSEERLQIAAESLLTKMLIPVNITDTGDVHLRLLHQRAISTSVRPPAWACLELSADLEPGSWYPVSSARLHPGDGLCVPVHNGDNLVLSVSPNSALEYNARVVPSINQPRVWWIAAPLQSYASLSPGAMEQPTRIARRAVEKLEFCGMRVTGSVLQAWVAPNVLSLISLRSWTLRCDVPDLEGNAPSPQIMVAEGQSIRSGSAWVKISAETYSSAPTPPTPQSLIAVTKLLKFTAKDIFKPSLKFEYVPPGVDGRVTSIEMQEKFDRFGIRCGWSLVAVVTTDCEVHADLLLPDGRLAPIAGLLQPENAPYQGNAALPQIVIEDPLLNAEAVEHEEYTDPKTGGFIAAQPIEPLIWVRRDDVNSVVLPDIHLRTGLIDREGLPATSHSPKLSESYRRWLAVAHPNIARELESIDRAWNADAPAYWSCLIEALAGAGMDPPSDGPEGWCARLKYRPRVEVAKYDPMRSALKHVYSQYIESWHAPSQQRSATWVKRYSGDVGFEALQAWQCLCGELRGAHRVAEWCEKCFEKVELYRRSLKDRPLPVFKLPVTVIHPWYRDEAAGVLGILRSEYDELVHQNGGLHVTRAVTEALDEPLRNIELRIQQSGGNIKSQLLRQKHRLISQKTNLADRLLLKEVPMLPPVLRPAGVPWSATDLLVSPINQKYRALSLAIYQYHRVGEDAPDWLQADVWIGLQDAVSDTLGCIRDVSSELDTVASIILRILPTSRSSYDEHSLPGLFRAHRVFQPESIFENNSPQRYDWAAPWSEYLHGAAHTQSTCTPSQRPRLGIVTRDGPYTLPEFKQLPAPHTAEFWTQKYSRHIFLERHLTTIAAIFGQLDGDEELAAYLELYGGVDLSAASVEVLGAVILREMVRLFDHPYYDASGFCMLLEARLPLNLPAEPNGAYEKFVERLALSQHGSEREDFVARALFYVFAGWWQTQNDESAWRWHPAFDQPDDVNRRSVPPLSSPAWSTWPGIDFGRAPARWLRDTPTKLPSTIRSLLHWNTPAVPELFAADEGVVVAEVTPRTTLNDDHHSQQVPFSPLEAQPEQRAAPQFEERHSSPNDDVCILESSLRRWISNTPTHLFRGVPPDYS